MNLGELNPNKGANKKHKRLGRGLGSGLGKTAGRGVKGQTTRGKVHPWFEGGQMPLQRRAPKRGFRKPDHRFFHVVNVGDLGRCEGVSVITPEVLLENGLVKGTDKPIKILGTGDPSGAFEVKAQAFSKSAREKIEAKGGKVLWIDDKGAETSAPAPKRPKRSLWGEGSRKRQKTEKSGKAEKDKKAKAGGKASGKASGKAQGKAGGGADKKTAKAPKAKASGKGKN